ncbi:hypothetical protein [Streptosporangium sp. NPDC051022]|uniref:hypothetical protein n=1 Tax=Streptosporangium sp. NPDC051022 TaxID=3155752 RepID=UPI00341B990B
MRKRSFPRNGTRAAVRVRAGAPRLYTSVGIEPGDREASAAQTMKNFGLFGAPHVAIITVDEALGVHGAIHLPPAAGDGAARGGRLGARAASRTAASRSPGRAS